MPDEDGDDTLDCTKAFERLIDLVGKALDERAIRSPHRKVITRAFIDLMKKLERARGHG